MKNQDVFDYIIIGSGIGGLTAATLLTRLLNKRVLILEQHFKAGGLTHSFKRKGFEWDVGLHYVGEMQKGGFARKLMDFVTNGNVQWQKMPEAFETFHFKDFTFTQESSNNFRKKLNKEFPDQEKQIEMYFQDIKKTLIWGQLRMASQILPFLIGWIPRALSLCFSKYSKTTLLEYFNSHNIHPKLQKILSAQCGDYGLVPREASFFIHALVSNHYRNGGYYPKSGGQSISIEAIKSIELNGSEIRLNHSVTRIRTKNGHVIGVEGQTKGKDFSFKCSNVISTAGARSTFLKLLKDNLPKNLATELNSYSPSSAFINLYIGFSESPKRFGFQGENHWVFNTENFESLKQTTFTSDKNMLGYYLSFPTLKNTNSNKKHTATMISPMPYSVFDKWKDTSWKARGEDYENLKNKIVTTMLKALEDKYPGLTDIIEYTELSTPLTTNHFTGHHMGESYGVPGTIERYKSTSLGPRTHIKGLYLGGADVLAHGVVGAMSGGLVAVTASVSPLQVGTLFNRLLAHPASD